MPKQLGQFLQEKQEPFALNVYLIERGYLKHKFYSSKNSTCKTSNISTSIPLHYKKITLIPNCPKIVRSFITKISSFSKENKLKKSVGEERKEDSNQHSPVSVLEETEFDDDDGATQNHEKRTQESSSKLEKSFEVRGKESQEVTIGCKFIEHYTKNKNAVLRSNQLLFDCVREVLENQTPKKEKGCQLQLQKFLGAQELWKLIYKNIWSWSKEVIVDDINVEQVVHENLLTNSLRKWNNFEEQTREIGIDIEASIFEDISNEIIKEIIDFV